MGYDQACCTSPYTRTDDVRENLLQKFNLRATLEKINTEQRFTPSKVFYY